MQVNPVGVLLAETHVNETSWHPALQEEYQKPYYKELSAFINQERQCRTDVYPPADQVFNFTRFCKVDDVKVVILGQEPYNGPGKAHGLSFSVPYGVRIPRSLLNIYTELENDIVGFQRPGHGTLIGWAIQGVLLLNACLTARRYETARKNFHKGKGWEKFTYAVISWLIKNKSGIVFMLWGNDAQRMEVFRDPELLFYIHTNKHLILTAAHPSSLSAYRGFFGCKHFSLCNQHLATVGKTQINWKWLPAL